MIAQKKLTDPPLSVAVTQALKSIRIRFVRQLATGLGITLGLAFFASVKTSQAITHVSQNDPQSLQQSARLQWLIAVSLVLCTVGIANSMLMSVTERFREIGTLKCLGATDSFIIKVFLLEALIIGTSASLIGALMGIAISLTVRLLTDGYSTLPNHWLPAIVLIAALTVLLGISLTVLAAIIPSIQAAKMPAIAALRVEV
jgi:putative ABC transport system permease protein